MYVTFHVVVFFQNMILSTGSSFHGEAGSAEIGNFSSKPNPEIIKVKLDQLIKIV